MKSTMRQQFDNIIQYDFYNKSDALFVLSDIVDLSSEK